MLKYASLGLLILEGKLIFFDRHGLVDMMQSASFLAQYPQKVEVNISLLVKMQQIRQMLDENLLTYTIQTYSDYMLQIVSRINSQNSCYLVFEIPNKSCTNKILQGFSFGCVGCTKAQQAARTKSNKVSPFQPDTAHSLISQL